MTAKLMIALVGAFMLQMINISHMTRPTDVPAFIEYFALSPAGLRSGYVWQVFTFQFLHGGLTHLLFNLLGLWFIGRVVEQFLGATRFLYVYLIGGVIGGVLQGLLAAVFPGSYGGYVVGASAGLSALLSVFCLMAPQAELRVMLVIPLKAIWVFWISLGIAGFFTLVPPRDNIAHAAHLGGLLFGALFVVKGWHQDFHPLPGARWWQAFVLLWKRAPKSNPRSTPSTGKDRVPPRVVTGTVPPKSEQEFMAREVDPILDKIAAHGIHSLTERERAILENARKKIRR